MSSELIARYVFLNGAILQCSGQSVAGSRRGRGFCGSVGMLSCGGPRVVELCVCVRVCFELGFREGLWRQICVGEVICCGSWLRLTGLRMWLFVMGVAGRSLDASGESDYFMEGGEYGGRAGVGNTVGVEYSSGGEVGIYRDCY